jgi:hypothetical protein
MHSRSINCSNVMFGSNPQNAMYIKIPEIMNNFKYIYGAVIQCVTGFAELLFIA